MYFLIGLGVIVVLVYGNMLYDHIKEKKKADEQTDMTEKMQTKAGDEQTESVKASDQISENGSDKAAVCHFSGPTSPTKEKYFWLASDLM